MSDIFGPDTRINRQERRISERLVKGRRMLYPVFNGSELYSLYDEFICGERNNLGVDFFDIFEKEMIIPFDFIDIPNGDFMVPTKNGNGTKLYSAKHRKYISKPDFLYVGFDNNLAHVFPIDLKSTRNGSTNQTSMMNTATLFHHSNYMQNIVKYLKDAMGVKVIFENGFYLFEQEREDSNKGLLEKYIEDYLPNSVQKRDNEDINLGIDFRGGVPKLVSSLENLFLTNLDYDVEVIENESKLIAYLSFIKGRVGLNTTYPNLVTSINGFNGSRKPIFRLDFDPTNHIKSYNPEIEILSNEIDKFSKMSPEEVASRSLFVSSSLNEKNFNNLSVELDAKRRDLGFRVKERIEEIIGESIEGDCSEEDFDKYVAGFDEYVAGFDELKMKIGSLEKDVELAKMRVIDDRGKSYEKIFKKGSVEWHNENWRQKDDLITKMVSSMETEERKLTKWKKKDSTLTKLLSNFYLKSLLNEDFTLAESPYFPLPQELYLQLEKHNLMRVFLYNSFKLKD